MEGQYQVRTRKQVIFGNGLVYYPVKGLKTLHAVIYEPAIPDVVTSLPCIVIVRGTENTGEIQDLALYMASRGYVILVPEYRVSNELGPGQKPLNVAIDDIRASLVWARNKRNNLRIAPNRLFLAGFSEGATTVLELVYHRKSNIPLKGAIVFRGKFKYRDPVRKKTPPLLVMNSTTESPPVFQEGLIAEALLKRSGVPCTVWTADGKNAYWAVAEFCNRLAVKK